MKRTACEALEADLRGRILMSKIRKKDNGMVSAMLMIRNPAQNAKADVEGCRQT